MKSKYWIIYTLIFMLLLSGCSLPNMGASNANIDINIVAPLPQSQFVLGETITIQSMVSASSGVEKIELLANEEVVRSDSLNAPLTQGKMTQGWLPEIDGIYALQTRATTANGETFISNIVTIAVVGDTSQPVVPTTAVNTVEAVPTAVATATLAPTETSMPPTVIATATLIPSATPLASPTAATLPAPMTLNPSGSLSCRSSVFIEWVPIEHPNGIAYYEWEITGTGIDIYKSENETSIEYFVTCGMSYSWRVRAVDGLGNIGPYSEEVFFSIE